MPQEYLYHVFHPIWASWLPFSGAPDDKSLGGRAPSKIQMNNHSTLDDPKPENIYDTAVRAYQRQAWLIANEVVCQIQFVLGAKWIQQIF